MGTQTVLGLNLRGEIFPTSDAFLPDMIFNYIRSINTHKDVG